MPMTGADSHNVLHDIAFSMSTSITGMVVFTWLDLAIVIAKATGQITVTTIGAVMVFFTLRLLRKWFPDKKQK